MFFFIAFILLFQMFTDSTFSIHSVFKFCHDNSFSRICWYIGFPSISYVLIASKTAAVSGCKHDKCNFHNVFCLLNCHMQPQLPALPSSTICSAGEESIICQLYLTNTVNFYGLHFYTNREQKWQFFNILCCNRCFQIFSRKELVYSARWAVSQMGLPRRSQLITLTTTSAKSGIAGSQSAGTFQGFSFCTICFDQHDIAKATSFFNSASMEHIFPVSAQYWLLLQNHVFPVFRRFFQAHSMYQRK